MGRCQGGCVEKCFIGLAFFVAVRLSRYILVSAYDWFLQLAQRVIVV